MHEHSAIGKRYFNWLCGIINHPKYDYMNYLKLLSYLHSIAFKWSIPTDSNRASDGVDLRYRFADDCNLDYRYIASELDISDCSVLEMMVALARRCEVNIMSDSEEGDRTGMWFWEMIENLGLEGMNDISFNERLVELSIQRMLNRKYGSHGEHGLFTVCNPRMDMRITEIWYQAMWYLSEVYGD